MNPRPFILVIVLIASIISCKRSKFDSDLKQLEHDGERRTYLLHVPDNYDEGVAHSLVIALHGGTGSARNLEEQSGLVSFSEHAGFILCSPNGVNRTWNAGECCGKAAENNVDDVGFIDKLIDEVSSLYNLDPNRIYATGMSNGGFMCYRLACELSHRIAAIAPVAASMTFDDCEPSEAISVIHFHAINDESVPIEGGVGNGLSAHENTALKEIVQRFVTPDSCDNISEVVFDDYTLSSWSDCADLNEFALYVTGDGGHSWPGGTKPRKKADEPSQAIDANALMWTFFQNHPKR